MAKIDRIQVEICTHKRAGELAMLLTSLMYQTYQDWDLILLDGHKESPIRNQKYINDILIRMKLQGHGVKYIVQQVRKGISNARNIAVEAAFPSEWHLRIDDDSVLDPMYIEKLFNIIYEGQPSWNKTWDGELVFTDWKLEDIGIVGGIVPYFGGPILYRNSEKLGNLFERITYNNGKIEVTDYGGNHWYPKIILPSHHIRSSYLFRKSLWDKVNGFSEDMGGMVSGYREETDFCIKAAYEGYKFFVDTSAIAWHIRSASGGVKPETPNPMQAQQEYAQAVQINENHFQRKFMRLYRKKGDPYAQWR